MVLFPDTDSVTGRLDSTGVCGELVPVPGNVPGCASKHQLPEITETESEECGGCGSGGFVGSDDAASFDIAATYSTGGGGDDLFCLPPLFQAVLEGRARAVRLLLRYGACPHAQDRHGCTPLHLACSPHLLNVDCCHFLLRYGAKVHVKNCSGVTPYLLYPKVAELQRSLVTSALTRVPTTGSLPAPHATSSNSRKLGGGAAGGLGLTSSITASPHPSNPLAGDPAGPSTSTGENQRSGSVSRFFKRLSSKSRSLGA